MTPLNIPSGGLNYDYNARLQQILDNVYKDFMKRTTFSFRMDALGLFEKKGLDTKTLYQLVQESLDLS